MEQWTALTLELDRWHAAGEVATFWWRDDDAVSDTPELHDLLSCAGATPIALAVIPALADRSLAERLRACRSATVLQHGWSHENHAGCTRSEYPSTRDEREVANEFLLGQRILGELFRSQNLPVFAPPWHGFDECHLPLLKASGLAAISRKGARSTRIAFGLKQSNVHCVPICWTNPPSFGSEADHLQAVLDHLEGRRLRTCDMDEPTGILTHHLVQDARAYEFMIRLVAAVSDHPGASWLSAPEVFGLS
jgi:peptidoglycan/xylan/chitin deacetylase (PgdA/CDA1 family)